MKYEFILSEVGASTAAEYLNKDKIEDTPIDTLLLTIFFGNVNILI